MTDDDSKPLPTTGTSESAAWFRAELEALGQTQAGFAKWMKRRGDDRPLANIERHIRRMASGANRVSGEMRVILNMMRKGVAKAEKAAQARAAQKSSGSEQIPSGADHEGSEQAAPGPNGR
ncbi:hypothetical protein EBE87_27125 [Pseudoroseomonas wenyumeiae]|uniref:Uncharacterized protein n=1 Tax=Teichococcus wenyumeiae TaxID=2478470 RepID=A0A3A9JDU2_9PROT|nr:hypothetical protein [Pseudoroseomonas wenyumeiae]RKK01674.1 hypothetical protein D6Z83_23705 [Pseudoroseomonas wenyumeiae]RMI15137.1 hypothetical protein EBE87_27125 [Pseudoroseomonas wenyumeiae]